MTLSPQQAAAITAALSSVRLGTYLNATGFSSHATALDIYIWNAQVSSAFFASLHICEVVMRNAISHAIELKYGANWPWAAGFERTLPKWSKGELSSARQGVAMGSTGKVIAELKFSFWCAMLTASQDQHVWNHHLRSAFPFMPLPYSVAGARSRLYDEMQALRALRNRIAHHEPIFALPLAAQQERIERLVRYRCPETEKWLTCWQFVSAAIAARP